MDSYLLQKQVRNNAKDLQEFYKELQDWGSEMKKKDESLKRSSNNQSGVPLPKSKLSKVTELDKETVTEKPAITKKTKKIKGSDYTAWDKFDADAYCAKMDKEDAGENSSPESDLSDEIDETAIDLANKCYTKAIECYAYDPIYYANRALCYLKQEKYRNAESDCTTSLQLDKTYVKAYQRRAAARESLNQISEAHRDLLKVLELEPTNKESKNVLLRIEKKLEDVKQEKATEIEEEPRPVSKFTLSRQKQKNTNVEIQQMKHDDINKRTPALSEHVIERVQPSTSGITTKAQQKVSGDNKEIIEGSKPNVELIEKDSLINRHNKENIQLFKSVNKPPKLRSKQPLKRIQIIDVDLQSEKKYLSNRSKQDLKENKEIEIQKEVNSENEKNKSSDILLLTPQIVQLTEVETKDETQKVINCFEDLNVPIPKTAVQFYNGWKTIKKEWRKNYLQRINTTDLKLIFKESLESKVFSEIIDILSENSTENTLNLYDYLLGLTEVKRFSALIMFMSSKDKKSKHND
ncbi:rna polymerase ii-associated protein 3 [Holotrichia oblita]|uniref:Rna polymerase ii-associated protein 3 n=1 Tax=Holotrichia oblita TaxID=644536 RepID=A0ACB9TKQ0_HOLOL|nr:rna polymerase ii-associated protein 3 [Holotrichia oblita]